MARPVTGKLILVFGAISCRKSAGEKLTKSGSMIKLLSIKIAICTINPVLNATKTCLIHKRVGVIQAYKQRILIRQKDIAVQQIIRTNIWQHHEIKQQVKR